jgi:hypothetical protein
MWDLWWTKWCWDRLLSEFFSFTLPILFHRGYPYLIYPWGMSNRPAGNRSSETLSHLIDWLLLLQAFIVTFVIEKCGLILMGSTN